MEDKFERNPVDYLRRIVRGLREAPRQQENGGVLVAHIIDDTCQAWAEFLSEILESIDNQPATQRSQTTHEADTGQTCPSCGGRGMRAYGDEPGLWHCYTCNGTGQV